MKILIIGSNDRASLVIARSLGRERFTLDNISFTGKTITNYSRYIRKSFYLNNINNDFHNSCEKLFKIIKDEKYDYIIPVNDWRRMSCPLCCCLLLLVGSLCRIGC